MRRYLPGMIILNIKRTALIDCLSSSSASRDNLINCNIFSSLMLCFSSIQSISNQLKNSKAKKMASRRETWMGKGSREGGKAGLERGRG